jgi:hypothetical protein
MSDTKHPRTATEGTWALPLLALAPLTAISLLANTDGLWLTLSWVLFAVSVLLVANGWATVIRHGTRGSAAWGACIVVHAALIWRLISLVQR